MTSARLRKTQEFEDTLPYPSQNLDCPTLLASVAAVEAIARRNCSDKLSGWLQDLHARVVNGQLRIAVVGQFKRGKTSLLNALLGQGDLLPVGTLPFTSILTIVQQGSHNTAEVVFQSGMRQSIPLDELRDYVTETGNPDNCKMVEHVEVSCTADILNDGVQLINSPGFGSLYDQSTRIAYDYLPRIDAAVFVTSPEPPLTAAEMAFLRELISTTPKVFVVMNKVDLLNAEALGDVLRFTQNAITRVAGESAPRIYPISVLQGTTSSRNPTSLVGVRQLEADIRKFLAVERDAALLTSASRCLLTCISDLRTELESTLESAKEAGRTLELRRRGFEADIQAAYADHKRSEGLFMESVNRLGDLAENELRRFAESKRLELDAPLRAFVRDHDPTAKELLAGILSEFAGREIEQRFNRWSEELEVSLVQASTDAAERFLQSTNSIVEAFRIRILEQCSVAMDSGRISKTFGRLDPAHPRTPGETSLRPFAVLSLLPQRLLRYWMLRRATAAARQTIQATGLAHGKALHERLTKAANAFTASVRESLEDSLNRMLVSLFALQEQHETSAELQAQRIGELSEDIRKVDHLSAALSTSTGINFAMEA